jgi:hypothetical protein
MRVYRKEQKLPWRLLLASCLTIVLLVLWVRSYMTAEVVTLSLDQHTVYGMESSRGALVFAYRDLRHRTYLAGRTYPKKGWYHHVAGRPDRAIDFGRNLDFTEMEFFEVHGYEYVRKATTDWHFAGFGSQTSHLVEFQPKRSLTRPVYVQFVMPTDCWIIAIPWWAVGVPAVLSEAIFIRRWVVRRQREVRGLCLGCGYDLRGTVERCPECGLPIAAGEK